jgi:glycosyltransferase involved in cell wall biosynthesis
VKVLVVAEYYPRAGDPVRGVWAHRQALAARDAGAEIRVLVLHRPLPPLAALRSLDRRAIAAELRQPGQALLDCLPVSYVRYLSPPRPWSYGSWGAWAAPSLAYSLARLRRRFPYDLIHAHYAVPAGDAVRRVAPRTPLVISVHGGDVYGVGAAGPGARAVRAALGHARLVLANSAGTARRCAEHGARTTRVVHLGADPAPATPPGACAPMVLVTVANLVPRKRHEDVLRALAMLRADHPDLRYVVVGDGPQREPLLQQAWALGVADALELKGALDHAEAVAAARAATVFVLPSVDEAFGVAYVEAMAADVPVIGCRGEDGPEEIATAGGGIVLVPPRDPVALASAIGELLADHQRRAELGRQARENVERSFTWEQCGRATVEAYGQALKMRQISPQPSMFRP